MAPTMGGNTISWEGRFEELLVYKAEHGHCNVTKGTEGQYPGLSHWLKYQRQTKRTKDHVDRLDRLIKIGVVLNPQQARRDQQFDQMLTLRNAYKAEQKPKKNATLRHWMVQQRWLYKWGQLSKDRVDRLIEVGLFSNVLI